MDSLTHVVLGACVAEVMAPKAGKRVLLYGALAQSLPDIDFVATFWLDPASDLLAHRGFTHSFLFVALLAPLLAWLTDRFLFRRSLGFRMWTLFYFVELLIHVLIDAFNAYGVGWFEPFNQARISFYTVFVADPVLTLPILLAFGFLLFKRRDSRKRKLVAWLALSWCVAFLDYALIMQAWVTSDVRSQFERQGRTELDYIVTPTPLNTWLWYIVANDVKGSLIGYRSVFDKGDSITFEYFPRSEELLAQVADHMDLKQLKRFSAGYYTAERWGDTLVFNDLRFGQMLGWRDRRARFVFHYFLDSSAENTLVVQRGRFKGWDANAVKSLLNRALGNQVSDPAPPAGNRK